MNVEMNTLIDFRVPEINFPVILNPKFVLNETALNVINDQLELKTSNQNPFFANVNNFNQNIGILQTAVQGMNEILQMGDILKNFSTPDKEILNNFSKQINSIIQNTAFMNIPVFNNSVEINGEKINLSIPKFEPQKTDLKTYFQEIQKKQESLQNVLKNLAFTSPIEKEYNPQKILQTVLKENGTNLYNLELLNLQNLQLLLS